MENKLLEIIKLVDTLDEKQDKVYAQITYSSNKEKVLEIAIRSKKDFSFIKSYKFDVDSKFLVNWDLIIESFKSFVGGVEIE